MFCLYDTHNKKIVSRHRTVAAAEISNDRLQHHTKNWNGLSSYIPTELRIINEDGEPVRLNEDSPEWQEWVMGG